MIQFNADRQLQILLTHQNKAFAEAVRHATPEQLELLQQGKDIKGVLSAIAAQSLHSDKSAPILLEILKNSPAFQEMGRFAADLKQTVAVLRADPALQPLAVKLDALLPTASLPENAAALKQQVADSGIFLESRLAQMADPKRALLPLLQELSAALANSRLSEAATALRHVENLIAQPTLQPSATADDALLQRITGILDKILAPLQNAAARPDPLYAPAVERAVERLQAFIAHLSPPREAPNTAPQSPAPASTPTASSATSTPPSMSAALLLESPWVRSALQSAAFAPGTTARAELLAAPQHYLSVRLGNVLEQLHTALLQSSLPDAKGVLQQIHTLFDTLSGYRETPLQLFGDAKVTTTLGQLTEKLQTLLLQADPIQSGAIRPLLKELAPFTRPEGLLPVFDEVLPAKDAKAVLMQVREELQQMPTPPPAAAEGLKQVDRLMLQIDYYQLYSHLSGNATLFFPYAWEMLDEGSLSFARGEGKRFYCRIDLTLQHFGAVDLMLSLDAEQRIDIRGFTEQEALGDLIRSQMPTLRTALRDAGLTPGIFRIAPRSERKDVSEGYRCDEGPDAGFEVTI